MLLCRLLILSIAVSTAMSKEPASTVEDSIAKIRAEWAKDLHEKRLDQITMLYAPNAVFIQPSGDRITGRPAIRQLCQKIMATFTSDLIFHSINTEHSGSLAYDTGDYQERLLKLDDQNTVATKGSYLMIFKRQPDGKWLITQQIWTGVEPTHK